MLADGGLLLSLPRRPLLSVVIPLAPVETAWCGLAADLAQLPAGSEIILASHFAPKGRLAITENLDGQRFRIVWAQTPRGRAVQLNAGANAATGQYLWFLHADSRLSSHRFQPRQAAEGIQALVASIRDAPEALHFFDLKFLDDGPSLMPVNALGAWVRSHALGMPFGDQGFCVKRTTFERLGGFDPRVGRGEDHHFVWQAGRSGVELRCTNAPLFTSARRYRDRGWAPTTLRHVVLTYKQALPEIVLTLKKRIGA